MKSETSFVYKQKNLKTEDRFESGRVNRLQQDSSTIGKQVNSKLQTTEDSTIFSTQRIKLQFLFTIHFQASRRP